MKQLYGLILVVILFLSFPSLSKAGKTVPLPHLKKPDSISTDHRQIYITDQETVYIYSLKDFKLKKSIGKRGDGPGEFRVQPKDKIGLRIALHNDYILVNSFRRASFFSKDGEFKNQFNLINPVQFLKPLGNDFVGFKGIDFEDTLFIVINIYTPLKPGANVIKIKKELWRKEHDGQISHIPDCLKLAMSLKDGSHRGALYQVYNNQVFLEGNNNEILVFDDSGDKLYTIHHEYEKINIPDSFKQKINTFFEKEYPTLYQVAQHQGRFPAYFPIRYFFVADNKIYVLTFKNLEGKSELYLSDLKGKLLKKVMIPFAEAEFLLPYPYTINNDRLYQVKENPDTGKWELNIHQIK